MTIGLYCTGVIILLAIMMIIDRICKCKETCAMYKAYAEFMIRRKDSEKFLEEVKIGFENNNVASGRN